MARVTKKMKMEELECGQKRIRDLIMMCCGLSANRNNNIVDEYGKILTIPVMEKGKETKKYLKYGDGPFKFKERPFDPVNNYKLMVGLFNDFIKFITEEEMDEEELDEESISISSLFTSINTISLRDGKILDEENDVREKYVELKTKHGDIESERYICPTLGYIELIFAHSGILPEHMPLLRRVDELKYELES